MIDDAGHPFGSEQAAADGESRQTGDIEPAPLQRLRRVPIGVAPATHRPPGKLQRVLPESARGMQGEDVLEDEEPAAGAKHPADLVQRARQVGDRAQGQRGEDGVDAAIRKRKIFTGCLVDDGMPRKAW